MRTHSNSTAASGVPVSGDAPPSDAAILAIASSVGMPSSTGADTLVLFARALLAACAPLGVALPPVPDGVWEALQRLIENAATLGPASKEDALLVARWQGQFVAARERNAGARESVLRRLDPALEIFPEHPASGVPETFWLIERGANQGQSPTMWWSSKPDAVSTYSWVESVHEATRFDSAAAAEAMAQAQYITHYAVTSHNYVDGGQR